MVQTDLTAITRDAMVADMRLKGLGQRQSSSDADSTVLDSSCRKVSNGRTYVLSPTLRALEFISYHRAHDFVKCVFMIEKTRYCAII